MDQLKYRNLTEDDKRSICAWKYPGEYAIYDLPSYEVMKTQRRGFTDPVRERNYFAFLENEVLVGYVNILPRDTEVFIGAGVAPDLCGRHYGRRILEQTCHIAGSLYPGKPLYLLVRTWNRRAVACYEKAGFHIEGEAFELTTGSGTGTFFRMVRE